MTTLQIGFLGIAAALALMALRVPIGVALGLAAFFGIGAVRGFDVALGMVKTVPFDFSAHWSLTAIPMFILMGTIANASGLTGSLFECARVWLARLPGGLAIASTFAAAGFSAATGSSVAAASAMSKIAGPEMLRQGYDKSLATGTIAAAGTLGSLIPPSILFVIFGMLAEESISKLLIAGVLPGVLTAVVYAAMIYLRCVLTPGIAPPVQEVASWRERWLNLWEIWPVMLLVIGVIGSIYGGVATPTEAGALGATIAALIALARGRLSMRVMKDSAVEALVATARIFFVAIGAVLFTRLMALTGVPIYLGDMLGSWAVDPLWLVIGASIVYLLLGCVLDPLGLMLVTLPVFLPMFKALDLDMIWFGVLVIKYVEIGLITPPVGMNLFVVKSTMGDVVTLNQVIRGASWFLLCELLIMTLLIAYPAISTYLPSLM